MDVAWLCFVLALHTLFALQEKQRRTIRVGSVSQDLSHEIYRYRDAIRIHSTTFDGVYVFLRLFVFRSLARARYYDHWHENMCDNKFRFISAFHKTFLASSLSYSGREFLFIRSASKHSVDMQHS